MIRSGRALLLLVGLMANASLAQDISGGIYADLRLTSNSSQNAAVDGGLGKLRYGGNDGADQLAVRLADINGWANLMLSPDLLAYADVNYDPRQRLPIDLDEAYLRYRPVSLSPWRWSVKIGAFFPPLSLENTGPGWSSQWTLTPSAINSWVGEELRTIGGEARIEWRGDVDRLAAYSALYGANDPAGVLIAARGWDLTDRITGVFDRIRLPDASFQAKSSGPVWRQPFAEIDGNPGYYAGLDWRHEGWGRINILFYDNRGDPHAFSGHFAWKTGFAAIGAETEIMGVTLMAQGLSGKTVVDPEGDEGYATHFDSAFLLAGYRWAEWRIALRGELFETTARWQDPGARLSEHGHAETLALTWRPMKSLRLTAEAIQLDSFRDQRQFIGQPAQQADRQFQLNARISY
jgi:hypothetical protein